MHSRSRTFLILVAIVNLLDTSRAAVIPTDSATVIDPGSVQIVRYENMQAEDNYQFDYHTSDGQKRMETGTLVDDGQELIVRGSYSYLGPDNRRYVVEYVADRNGFRPILKINSDDDAADNPDEDPDSPPISAAGIVPDRGIRPHVIKALVG